MLDWLYASDEPAWCSFTITIGYRYGRLVTAMDDWFTITIGYRYGRLVTAMDDWFTITIGYRYGRLVHHHDWLPEEITLPLWTIRHFAN
jgi:hypothetical protein